MPKADARSTVASRRVADDLRHQILTGQLLPGTRIIQDEIAEKLNSSRLPVREALRILESDGLVTAKPNSGAWVSSMSLSDCEISYKMREKLEPLLLAESMCHLTRDDLAELSRIQEEIEANDDLERFLLLDRELHWASYRRNEAPELAKIVQRLWNTTQHYRRAFSRQAGDERRWVIHSEHRLLIDAVTSGDTTTAQEVLETHIRRTRVELADHPEAFQ